MRLRDSDEMVGLGDRLVRRLRCADDRQGLVKAALRLSDRLSRPSSRRPNGARGQTRAEGSHAACECSEWIAPTLRVRASASVATQR
jgi:hypothetical protein